MNDPDDSSVTGSLLNRLCNSYAPRRLELASTLMNPLTSISVDGRHVKECSYEQRPLGADEVAIRVRAVGICRTDLYVMDGTIPAQRPVIPGHEFAGVVVETGSHVKRLKRGDRVAVNPIIPCGECGFCRADNRADCQHTSMLGVDRDGACCSVAIVPGRAAFLVPDSLSFEEAAFAEPVAACLAVTRSGIERTQVGLIVGENRIARLTERILLAHGFSDVSICAPEGLADVSDCEFDFAIETHATTEVLSQLIRVIRPRGRIVLKSRQYRPVELTLRDLLPKEPVLQAVNYGRFDEAVALLVDRRVDVSDLIGQRFAFSDLRLPSVRLGAKTLERRSLFLTRRFDGVWNFRRPSAITHQRNAGQKHATDARPPGTGW